MAGARYPGAWGLDPFSKGEQSPLSSPDTHVMLAPLRQSVEARRCFFVPPGGWEMDVAGSSGIHFLVTH